MNDEPAPKPACLTRLLGVLLRLVFTIVVGLLLGAGLYFGFQALYSQFLIPVQQHALRLDTLELQQQQSNETQAQRLQSLASRLETIEAGNDQIKESLSMLDNKIDHAQTLQETQDAQLKELQNQLEVQEAALKMAKQNLQDQNEQIQSDRSAALAEFEELSTKLQAIQTEAAKTADNLLENTAAFNVLQIQVAQQTQLLSAMELLTRARLNLAQGNLSLARLDIEAARAVVLEIQDNESADQAAYFAETLTHLDRAGEFLPLNPVGASDEVEAAWQLLQESLALKPETPLLTGTPSAAVTPTPTPTP